jgi:hypothetical protein
MAMVINTAMIAPTANGIKGTGRRRSPGLPAEESDKEDVPETFIPEGDFGGVDGTRRYSWD